MPFCGIQPWRQQFFKGIFCPEDVCIPFSDSPAWARHPKHCWIYDKLKVALSQGLPAAPHGVIPAEFPIFSKPITNLGSLGVGSMPIFDLDTYLDSVTPGHFWTTLLSGKHISTDAIVVQGNMTWWRHATCIPGVSGTFQYFHVHSNDYSLPEIESWCQDWTQTNLSTYTGVINFELIGNRIIELHLRPSTQWIEFYGRNWIRALVELYSSGVWDLKESIDDEDSHVENGGEGFSIPLFGPHGPTYCHPPPEDINPVLNQKDVCSLQISFDETREARTQSNPPGGFRLVVINSRTLHAGLKAKEMLRNARWIL